MGEQNFSRKYIFIWLSVALTMGGFLAFFLWNAYNDTVFQTQTLIKNTASVMDARLVASIRRIQSNLIQISESLPPESLDLKKKIQYQKTVTHDLKLRSDLFPELNSYRIYDVNGDALYSSADSTPPKKSEPKSQMEKKFRFWQLQHRHISKTNWLSLKPVVIK